MFPYRAVITDWITSRRRLLPLSNGHDESAHEEAANVARGMGLASIGLGLTEIAASRPVEQALGLEDSPEHRGILQTLGVREVLHGVNILTQARSPAGLASGLWSRVAGDVLDTALLGLAATRTKSPARFAAISAAVMVIGAIDLVYAIRLSKRR